MESPGHTKGTDKITRKATNSLLRCAELCIQNEKGHFGKQSVQRNGQLSLWYYLIRTDLFLCVEIPMQTSTSNPVTQLKLMPLFVVFHSPLQNSPSGPGPPHYQGFIITLGHTICSRTLLHEWSAKVDLYLKTHNNHKRQISIPPAGFETTIPVSQRPQAHSLDHTATRISFLCGIVWHNFLLLLWDRLRRNGYLSFVVASDIQLSFYSYIIIKHMYGKIFNSAN